SELSKFDEAEKMHLKALSIKKKIAEHFPDQVLPELILTLLDLGDLYAGLNKFEKAEPMFTEALQISQKLAEQNPEIYMYNIALIQNSLGAVYSKLQKFKKAEQFYLEALKIFKLFSENDPKTYLFNVADVQNNLGNLYLILNDTDKAGSYFNKALKNDPTNISILYNMACLESLRKNQIKALELLTKVIELDETFIEIALEDDRLYNIRNLKEFKDLIGESSS
ncbi:MAG: tetratricopeptide repeat protein, partial [Candidatus Odinarchaeota archaeon]